MWRPSLSGQEISLDEAYSWYRNMDSMLDAHRHGALRGELPDFLHQPPSSVRAHFDALKRELDLTASLTIFAAAEAALMVDFAKRGKHGRRWPNKDVASYLKNDQRGYRPILSEVVAKWRTLLPVCDSSLNTFNACERYRHWLAHGRYYTLKTGSRGYDPAYVYLLLRDTVDCIVNAAGTVSNS